MVTVKVYAEVSLPKHPGATLDYCIDWSTWLGDDVLTSSTWTSAEGVVVESSTNDSKKATVWLSGGTANTKYLVTNTIATAAGRQETKSVYIKCTSTGGA